ncbi:MAG: hypothetical protein OHK0046_41820 [Anaerolineae bacterium]
MINVEWAEPALLWGDKPLNERVSPQVVELTTDNFLPDFLDAMAHPPEATSNPAVESFLRGHLKLPAAGQSSVKLFQPFHNRYNLVVGSLICRQVGLPDKTVDLKEGEQVVYVIRRRATNGTQYAWVIEGNNGRWVPLNATERNDLHPQEERLPLHRIKVCTGRNTGIVPCERTIHYGYIPAGNQQKYLEAGHTPLTIPDPGDTEVGNQEFINNYWGCISSKDSQGLLPVNPQNAPTTQAQRNANLAGALRNLMKPEPRTPTPEPQYVLRMAYIYDPACPAVLSKESVLFRLAPLLDPDAPPRYVKLQMPSLNDLARSKSNVGIQMGLDLRQKISQLPDKAADIMNGSNPGERTDLSLGMICVLSIQIVTIVAMILMMAMAIVLNTIFQWLPYLMIWLPIPKQD